MTNQISEIDSLREQAILSSIAGFPFLLVFSIGWIVAGGLSYFVPHHIAAWIYVLQGVPGVALAIALERRMGYVSPPAADPLLPLALQLMFVQILAFPAVALVWDLAPAYMPVAWAAVVGAHFLPFQWIYCTRLYGVLGVVVAAGPYVLGAIVGQDVIHYTGFLVGGALLIGAFLARSHARATWLRTRAAA